MSVSVQEHINDLESKKIEIENSICELSSQNDEIANEILKINVSSANIRTIMSNIKTEYESSKKDLELELEKLETRKEELFKLKEENHKKIERFGSKLDKISDEIISLKDNNSKQGAVISITKNITKKAVTSPFYAAKNVTKTAVSKFNPFDKDVNKHDVSDTGVESIKLANKSIKKTKNTVKTVKRTVKTSKRTIKTANDIVKTTGKAAYKTTVFTAKAIIQTAKISGVVVANVIALAMNPIVIGFAALIIIFVILASSVVILLGGGGGGGSTNGHAQSGAVGLVDVPAQYQEGLQFYNTAVENRKNDFLSIIDSMHFSDDDLTHSDLVYMQKTTENSSVVQYEKSYSNDERKNTLKSSWDISVTDIEAIAIAYVYLEKQLNNENGTERGIYEVKYSQEVFDTIISKCITYSDTTYAGQECPSKICTAHYYDNPNYQPALDNANMSAEAYNDWNDIIGYIDTFNSIRDGSAQTTYWDNEVQWRIDNWNSVYGSKFVTIPYYSNGGRDYLSYLGGEYNRYNDILSSTPQQLVDYQCDHQHTLHSIGLAVFNKNDVMAALEFTESDIQWVELTQKGFENNPNL